MIYSKRKVKWKSNKKNRKNRISINITRHKPKRESKTLSKFYTKKIWNCFTLKFKTISKTDRKKIIMKFHLLKLTLKILLIIEEKKDIKKN